MVEDTLIVSCYVCRIKARCHFLINTLNNSLATENGKRFSREAGRCVTRWDYSDEFHNKNSPSPALRASSPQGARVKLPFLAQMGLHFGGYVNDYTNFPLVPWGSRRVSISEYVSEGARRAGEGLNLCKVSK